MSGTLNVIAHAAHNDVIVDVSNLRMQLATAGHLPPLVRRRAPTLDRIEGAHGTALGILADPQYTQTEISIKRGDTLVLCTDGVVEATSPGGEQFGFRRLEGSLAKDASDPQQLAHRLFRDLDAHVREAAQYDDLTLVMCGAVDP